MKLPQRTAEHVLEEKSNRFFQNCLPENWTITKPANDYGVDFIVHIFDGTDASPYEIHVQLKASQNQTQGEFEKVTLKVATFNHLKRILHIGMIIKYVAEDNEAYWALLADLKKPNQENDTITFNITKENKLSKIDWGRIEQYIKHIVDFKLSAGEALQYYNKKNRQ